VLITTHHPVHTLTFYFKKIYSSIYAEVIQVFPSCFSTHACYIPFIFTFICFFYILLAFDEVCRLWTFLLWNFIQFPVPFLPGLKRLSSSAVYNMRKACRKVLFSTGCRIIVACHVICS
jgi:hypothetical protein